MPSRDFCTYRKTSKRPRRFWEMDPEILHTYLTCPCRDFYECVFVFFFPAENVGSRMTQNIPKNTKPQRSGGGGKNIRIRLGRGTLNTWVKFHDLSLNNSVDNWTLNEYGYMLEPEPAFGSLIATVCSPVMHRKRKRKSLTPFPFFMKTDPNGPTERAQLKSRFTSAPETTSYIRQFRPCIVSTIPFLHR